MTSKPQTWIRVRVYLGDQLTEDDAEGEDVALLVVELLVQTLGRHEVRGADLRKDLKVEQGHYADSNFEHWLIDTLTISLTKIPIDNTIE